MTDTQPWRPLAALPRAWGGPCLEGVLRDSLADFRVEEILGFAPEGEGEHLWLRVRKTGANTEWVARRLAAWASVPLERVSWAGLKDRRAVTEQWFSLHLAGREAPPTLNLDAPGVEVVARVRGRRKLRPGVHRGNRFCIRVRKVEGDREQAARILVALAEGGMPHYFGEQRFGRGYGNLQAALRLFRGEIRPRRHLRGLYLSAARAQLFNEVLGLRLGRGDWNRVGDGDWVQLEGSRSGFLVERADTETARRAAALDIHPTGPLWGAGDPACRDGVAALEQTLAADRVAFAEGLAAAGLEQERRALRVVVRHLEWAWEGRDLLVRFELPRGAYASALLRELL